jgi:putative serine/threonine protein kinase
MRILRGKHSTVFVKDGIARKVFQPDFRLNFWKEARFLTALQPFHFVPRLYAIIPEKLTVEMEFVEGRTIWEVIRTGDSDEIKLVALRTAEICRTLDVFGLQKEEMNHPDKHVIVSWSGRSAKLSPECLNVKLIDFERSKESSKPSNLTQFIIYLMRKRILVNRKDEMLSLLKSYKATYSEEIYRKIINLLMESFKY